MQSDLKKARLHFLKQKQKETENALLLGTRGTDYTRWEGDGEKWPLQV